MFLVQQHDFIYFFVFWSGVEKKVARQKLVSTVRGGQKLVIR